MSRHRKSRTMLYLFALISLLLFAVFTLIKKFIRVIDKKELWIEFLVSTSLLGLSFYASHTFLTFLKPYNLVIFSLYIVYWIFTLFTRRLTKNSHRWLKENFWRNLDPFEFEDEVADVLRALGYIATVTKERGDYGVDVITTIKGVKTAVQCKRYNGHKVTCDQVRDLWGAKDYYGCQNVIMIGLDGVTRSGKKFIEKFKERYRVMNIEDLLYYAERAVKRNSDRST